jgi:hypothetical protein
MDVLFALTAVFMGLFQMMMRDRAGIPRYAAASDRLLRKN